MSVKARSLIQLIQFYSETDTSSQQEYLDLFHDIDLQQLNDSSFREITKEYTLYLKNAFKHQEGISFLSKSLLSAKERGDTFSLALFHELITSHYFYSFQYDSCEYHINEAIKFYTELNNIGQLGLMTIRKSGIYYATGDYEKAIEFAFEATELFKTAKDEKQLALAYLQLGNIFYFLSNNEKAEQYYQLASVAFIGSDNEYGHYQAISNLGLVKVKKEEFEESIPIQLNALDYFNKNNKELEAGNAYRYLSAAYFGIKKNDSAHFYNELAIKSNLKTGYKVGLAEGYLMRSQLSSHKNDFTYAIMWAKKGYNLVDSIQHFESKKQITYELSKIYEKIGNIRLSHKFLKEYLVIKDSLDLDPNKLKDYAIRHQFKVEEAQFKLLLSEEKEKFQQKLNKKIENQLLIAVFVATVSILLLILVSIILVRNRKLTKELSRQKNRIKEELLIKESLLGEIHHRVKNNLQVVSSMLSLQAQYINNKEPRKDT